MQVDSLTRLFAFIEADGVVRVLGYRAVIKSQLPKKV